MSHDFLHETHPVARKAHRCSEEPACKRGIKPGDKYERVAGVWQGDFFAAKSCMRCAALRRKLASEDGEWPPFGDLLSWLLEARNERKPYRNGRFRV